MRAETIVLLIFIAIPMLIGVYYYKKIKIPYRILVFLLIVTFIVELIAEFAALIFRNNLVVYHFFSPIEYTLLALLFKSLIKNNKIRLFINFSILIYIPFTLINSFFIQQFFNEKINSHAILVESILVVYFSLVYLKQLLTSEINYSVYKLGAFWICLGCLLFFGTNVFFWGYYNYLIGLEGYQMHLFFRILFFENLVLYSLFGCALLIAIKEGSYE